MFAEPIDCIGFEAYDRLDECITFGERLIVTGDLDPVYIAIANARLPDPQLCRLLMAYWCYYSLGASAWLSEHEGADYWRWMRTAAVNQEPLPFGTNRWPRAAERRHFRGQKCVNAIDWLSAQSAEITVHNLAGLDTAENIMQSVKTWPMFGPWISFKIVDMIERVYGAPIDIPASIPLMYDEPRAALDLLPEDAYERLLKHFSGLRAPPAYDRPCGPSEVETILCKFKSFLGGHYAAGKDIREVRHGLIGWGKTADRLLAAMPKEVL